MPKKCEKHQQKKQSRGTSKRCGPPEPRAIKIQARSVLESWWVVCSWSGYGMPEQLPYCRPYYPAGQAPQQRTTALGKPCANSPDPRADPAACSWIQHDSTSTTQYGANGVRSNRSVYNDQNFGPRAPAGLH